jgi:exopolyphosphatase / guanosine-5'-triphosphate,3'-diphosphate pyrophosphatase
MSKKSITTNLAEDFFETKLIKEEAMERTLEALKDLKEEGIKNGVSDFKLIGTKVIRDASNAEEFIERISEETGLKLDILSKEEESRLVVKAVEESFSPNSLDLVIINAGGGSTQISYKEREKIREYSLPIGISDLNEKFLKRYPISKRNYVLMKNYIKETLTSEIKNIDEKENLVYTGGELDYMLITGFPLEDFKGSISHPKKISTENFKNFSGEMRKLSLEEIQSFMPANPNWMNGAIASNTLLEVLCDLFKIKTIIPSNKNLNDGIIITMK